MLSVLILCLVAFVAAQPALLIQGQNKNIVNGDLAPSVDDGTDFGIVDLRTPTPVEKAFTVSNLGSALLTFAGPVTITPTDVACANVFTAVALPATLAVGATFVLKVTYTPPVHGVCSADVLISSDAPAFTFRITGKAIGK